MNERIIEIEKFSLQTIEKMVGVEKINLKSC